jgi:nucleoside-diphosphate-sugar epimerase
VSVLITGATGFIGVNLAEALLARGDTVVLVSRRSIRPDPATSPRGTPPAAFEILSRLPGTLHTVQGDVTDEAAMDRIFAEYQPDKVIHGAAITPGTAREREQARLTSEVNYMGTLSLLEAARRGRVARLIYLSSGAVYGLSAFAAEELDEAATIPLPDTIYSISKYAGERLSLRFRRIWDMDVVAARIGTAFGPWEWDTGVRVTLSAILQVTTHAVHGREAVLPDIVGRKDWVYGRDVADSTLAILDAPKLSHEVYNLGPGVLWTVDDWCARLAAACPGFSHRRAGAGEEPNVSYGTPDRAPFAIRRLVEDVGYRPRFGLAESFADYMAWIEATPEFWTP